MGSSTQSTSADDTWGDGRQVIDGRVRAGRQPDQDPSDRVHARTPDTAPLVPPTSVPPQAAAYTHHGRRPTARAIEGLAVIVGVALVSTSLAIAGRTGPAKQARPGHSPGLVVCVDGSTTGTAHVKDNRAGACPRSRAPQGATRPRRRAN